MSTSEPTTPHDMLRFEAKWPHHSAAKEHAIAAEWGMSTVRYYQVLARVAGTTAAVAADPLLVARIRHQRLVRRPLLRESAEHSELSSVASSGGFELLA